MPGWEGGFVECPSSHFPHLRYTPGNHSDYREGALPLLSLLDTPAIAAYRAALPPGTLLDFSVTALDRISVASWSLTFWPTEGPDGGAHGYGLTDTEARTGAYGELSEVVHAAAALRRLPRRAASYRALVNDLGERGVLDPVAGCLDAGSAYTPDLPLEWVPVTRYSTGESVWVPAEFVAIQPADLGPGARLITPITNGLGAGLSLDQALAHGLLELVQRDGNSVNFRAMAQGTVVDLGAVTDATTRLLLGWLDTDGVDVLVKLASTDFGISDIYVVGMDREPMGAPLMAAACGEAAHPDRDVALRKALLEFCAARARLAFTHGPLGPVEAVTPPGYLDAYRRHYSPAGEEPRALAAMRHWRAFTNNEMRRHLSDSVLSDTERVPFASLPTVPDSGGDKAALVRLIADRLMSEGLDILYVDCSPPDASDVHVVKAIVPGLEVETMSYYRIGARNLARLLARGSDLVGLGGPSPGTLPILLTDKGRESIGGPAWLDPNAVDRLVGPLYALYREPGRHAAALAAERDR